MIHNQPSRCRNPLARAGLTLRYPLATFTSICYHDVDLAEALHGRIDAGLNTLGVQDVDDRGVSLRTDGSDLGRGGLQRSGTTCCEEDIRAGLSEGFGGR